MMVQGSLLFLGTGSSAGIPVIGCTCPVCHSNDPRDRRLRTSALLTINSKNILIDPGPDFRTQALTHNITRLDGVIITHTHYDHIGGLEELRIYNFMQKAALPCLLSHHSLVDIHKMFYYLFQEKDPAHTHTAKFDFTTIEKKSGSIEWLGLPIQYYRYRQGGMEVIGIRIDNFAYLTDIKDFSDDIFAFLQGVTTLVISAQRFSTSTFHFTIDDAVDFVKKVGSVQQAYFVHMSHEIAHSHVETILPKGIQLAYDGLQIQI